jgi:glutamate racemase
LRLLTAWVKRTVQELMLNRALIMADTKHVPHGGYSPDMDSRAHEATYTGFVRFAEIGTAVVICHVLALAVGGIKHAWLTAIFGVILSLAAGAVGAFSPSIGPRAPAAVGVLLLLALIFY